MGVSARGHKEMSVPRACWFVSEGVLPRGGVGAWLRCSCWGAAPPQYTHLQRLERRGWPLCSPPPPQEGLPRLGW